MEVIHLYDREIKDSLKNDVQRKGLLKKQSAKTKNDNKERKIPPKNPHSYRGKQTFSFLLFWVVRWIFNFKIVCNLCFFSLSDENNKEMLS